MRSAPVKVRKSTCAASLLGVQISPTKSERVESSTSFRLVAAIRFARRTSAFATAGGIAWSDRSDSNER